MSATGSVAKVTLYAIVGPKAGRPQPAQFIPFCFAPKCSLTLASQTCWAVMYPDPANIFGPPSRILLATKSALKMSIHLDPITARTLSAMDAFAVTTESSAFN